MFECFDILLNGSKNFGDLFLGYVKRWNDNPVFFLLTQFNFIFLTFCIFTLGISSFIIVGLYFLYALDVGYKIYISDKISKNQISDELDFMLKNNIEIDKKFRILFSICVSIVFYLGL